MGPQMCGGGFCGLGDFPSWRELKVRKERVRRQGMAMEGEKFGPNLMFDERFFVSLSPKTQS